MMSFNNHDVPGFTLIEATIAVALVAFIGVALLTLQSTLLRNAARAHGRTERLLLAQQFLEEHQKARSQGEKMPTTRMVDDPPTTITYRERPVASNSPLHTIKGIVLVDVTASWQTGANPQELNLVTCALKTAQEEGS